MRFHLSLLFVYLLVCDISAQTNRFIYNLSRQAGGATRDFKMVLDVNPDEVKFYDYRFIEIDSANKKNPGSEEITSTSQLDARRRSYQETIKKYYNPIERDKLINYPSK